MGHASGAGAQKHRPQPAGGWAGNKCITQRKGRVATAKQRGLKAPRLSLYIAKSDLLIRWGQEGIFLLAILAQGSQRFLALLCA